MVTLEVLAQKASFYIDLQRKPESSTDFGDETTIGLRLRRVGAEPPGDAKNHTHGKYLGPYAGRFHVGTMAPESFSVSRLESYNSIEELHQNWQII